jgi:cell division protein FtsI (penicillin-binding protein 3)
MENRFPFGISRVRVKFLLSLSVLIWLSILARLAQIQIFSGPRYAQMARDQEKSQKILVGSRGIIYDRNGEMLAQNIPAYSFFSYAESLPAVRQLAAVFRGRLSEREIRGKKARKGFVWLARVFEKEEALRIGRKPISGVYLLHEERRMYPFGSLGVDWLGFVDTDGRGLAGLERYYDPRLKGDSIRRPLLRDARGNLYSVEKHQSAPRAGHSLITTIDVNMQAVLETELALGVEKSKAESGTGIFLNPKTGEILAMAYIPSGRTDPRLTRQKNRLIADIYEPGSTFKVVTAAAALEERKFGPASLIYTEKGVFKIGKHSIHDVHKYDWLTFEDAVVKSSNIALAKIGLTVGGPDFYETARRFGFGEKTGIDLPAEVGGWLPFENRPKELQLATNSIGYGVAVTALQLVCAYAAVANDGIRMKPHIVKEIRGEDGKIVFRALPQEAARAVSKKTAETLCRFFSGVVDSGTGRSARVEGIPVAGKTGTTKKPDPLTHRYLPGRYVASFAGFFPADSPRVVGLVTLDEPKGLYYGGEVAAPVFKRVAEKILSLIEDPLGSNVPALSPPLIQMTSAASIKEWEPSRCPNGMVPDFSGLSVRRALNEASARRLSVRVKGKGVVREQSPPPGSRAVSAKVLVLSCSPPFRNE